MPVEPTAPAPTSEPATKPMNSTKWLIANQQKSLNLNTFSSCMCFSDVNGDDDHRLIIGDYGQSPGNIRLLVFKGTNLQAQIKLFDYPVAVASFFMDLPDDMNVPSISVASGSAIFIYKNLKPFYKFTLPLCPTNSTEQEIWNEMTDKRIDTLSFRSKLADLRKQLGESTLCAKSQAFLDLDEKGVDELDKFIEDYKDEPLKKFNLITCMTTIKKSIAQEKQVCYLIIGTENCDLFIIEPDAFTVIQSMKLQSVPVFLEVSGGYDVEYRIMVNCRDGHIYTIKRNLKQPRLSVQLTSQACAMAKMNSNMVIACIDTTLSCYSSKGNCLWSIKQPAAVKCMAAVNIDMFGIRMIAVALANKEIIFYCEKNVFDTLLMDEVICSIKFGRFGREDNTLVLVGESGALTIMILKRTAKFASVEPANKGALADLASNTTKLNIPKKTNFFVDQTMRERENSIAIHRTFQQDLYRLKLITSRAYVKAINACLNPISSNNSHPIKLSVQIHGLGPIFKLVLELQNISVDQPSINTLFMTFKCNPKIYQISPNFIFIPFISPGNTYTFHNKVELINDLGLSESIRVRIIF